MFIESDYEKDFEKEGVVSIWLARFEAEETLRAYVEEHMDENEDFYSAFYLEFRMGYLDHDFMDAVKQPEHPQTLEELLRGASYGKSIAANIRAGGNLPDVSKYNSFICVYDYAFVPDADYVRQNPNVDFWGVVAYDLNSREIT
jgi:hypothetical protein